MMWADGAAEGSDGQILFGQDVGERNAVSVLKSALQDGLGNFEADEIVIAVGSVAIFGDLGYVEAKLSADVGFGILLIGDDRAVFFAEFGELEADGLIDSGMTAIVGGVVSKSAEGKGIFVEVGGFLDEIDDEVAAANVVGEVAEIFAAEGIVAHVLHDGAAVGEGVGLLEDRHRWRRESVFSAGAGEYLSRRGRRFLRE